MESRRGFWAVVRREDERLAETTGRQLHRQNERGNRLLKVLPVPGEAVKNSVSMGKILC